MSFLPSWSSRKLHLVFHKYYENSINKRNKCNFCHLHRVVNYIWCSTNWTPCNFQLYEDGKNHIYSFYLYYFLVILYVCFHIVWIQVWYIKLNSLMLVTMTSLQKQRPSTMTAQFFILTLNATCVFLFDHCRLEMSYIRSNRVCE